MNSKDIINFWFHEIQPKQQFDKDEALDKLITDRFQNLHERAARCELFDWRSTPEGRLAEVIVLDQFPRNMYRNSPKAFATDTLALALAQEAVHTGSDEKLPAPQRAFIYMPYMHSESRIIHESAARFDVPGLEYNYAFELKHKAIIDRFGRFPHRNRILGRESTSEEVEFLKQPGSGF